MIKQENDSNYECEFCNGIFSCQANLEKHLRCTHSSKMNIKCPICNAELTRQCFQYHMKEYHGVAHPKLEINDEIENESGEESENLLDASSEARDQNFESQHDDVSKEGPSEGGEKSLILRYTGVECKICHQVYSNKLNLKKHVYNVHKMVRVKCDVCYKEVNKKSLDRHMKNVHSAKIPVKKERKLTPVQEKILCTLCGKKCVSSMSLVNHIRAIHEAEQHKCSQCDFQGIQKHLERHIKKVHSGEVYQCSRCQKILKSKSTLKEHMWIHTDHRRFICDICGMRFKRTSNYSGHMKSHQEKKFQCRICGNFFLRKRYLAVHEQTIHNYYGEGVPPQEKGYQCEICGVKLKWKNNLLAHMRIHTGEKPYKCKICGDDFTCHGSLRTHMTKHSVCQTSQVEPSNVIEEAYLGGQKRGGTASLSGLQTF